METTKPDLKGLLKSVTCLYSVTLGIMALITFIIIAGIIVCIANWRCIPAAITVTVVVGGLVAVICAICWAGCSLRHLSDIQNSCRKQFLETELTLYREAVRRESILKDEQTTIAQLGLKAEAKHKEIELARLENELASVKSSARQ